MKEFSDNTGRTWAVTVNVAVVKRVHSLLGVHLGDVVGGNLAQRMIDDPVLMVDVIFAILKPEADERGVDDEEFARSMGGDALDNAMEAFLDEMVNEYLPPTKARLFAKAMTKYRAMMDQVASRAEKLIDSGDLERQLLEQMDQELDATKLMSGGD